MRMSGLIRDRVSAADAALGLPMESTRCTTWRCRLVRSTRSPSTTVMRPMPLDARQRSAAEPSPPAPTTSAWAPRRRSCASSPNSFNNRWRLYLRRWRSSIARGVGRPRRRGYFTRAAVAVVVSGRPLRWFNAAASCRSSFFALGSFLASSFASVLTADFAVTAADCPAAGPAMILSVGFAPLALASIAVLSSSTERWCCRSASRSSTRASGIVFLGRGEAHLRVLGAAVGIHDERVLRQERRGDGDGGIEQAARVQAQVEDQALQLAPGLLVEVVQRDDEVLAGVLLELGDADQPVAGLEHPRFHALHADHVAAHDEFERLRLVLAQHRELHFRVGLAAHALHGVGERDALQRHFVQLDDEVSRLDAGAVGRRVLDGGDDFHESVLGADLDAEAAEFALGADLQIAVCVLVEERRMRVEAREHSVDGFLQELAILDGLDVVALDASEDLAEEAQVIDGQHHRRSLAIRDGGKMKARGDSQRGAECHETSLLKLLAHASFPRRIQGAIHLNGSNGFPSRRSSKYRPDSASPPETPTCATGSPPRTFSPTWRSSPSLLAYRLIYPVPWSRIKRLPKPRSQSA